MRNPNAKQIRSMLLYSLREAAVTLAEARRKHLSENLVLQYGEAVRQISRMAHNAGAIDARQWDAYRTFGIGVTLTGAMCYRLQKRLFSQSVVTQCAWCKRYRDDSAWVFLRAYLLPSEQQRITHGCCPQCVEKVRDEAPCSATAQAVTA